MFNKVLVSDDLGIINEGVSNILHELNINEIVKTQYCDDSYIKIKKAILDDEPFDLLITDLSFKADYREQTFATGEDLIRGLRQDNIHIKKKGPVNKALLIFYKAIKLRKPTFPFIWIVFLPLSYNFF